MSNIIILIIIVLALIVLNGFFALSEIAIVTSKRNRLQNLADEGSKSAAIAVDLTENPNQFLSSIQVGITLIGILTGAIGGANIVTALVDILGENSILAPYTYEIAYFITIISITYITLIIGELVPKRLAMLQPETFASRVARPMRFISVAATPIVWLLSQSTKGMLFLFGGREKNSEPSVTTKEIQSMLVEGIEEGTVEEEEHDIIKRLFQFGDQDVGAVMTPRREIKGIDLDASDQENKQTLLDILHSRAVVYRDNIDETAGIIHVRSVLAQLQNEEPLDLEKNVKPVQFVSETTSAIQVLKYFRRTGEKMVIVVDEYGGIDGLVTLDDILEALIGNIPWVDESFGSAIIEQEDGSWHVSGKISIEKFRDRLGLPELAGAEEGSFRTVGGWVTNHLGHIPEQGESFEWQKHRFIVLEMDHPRVNKIHVIHLTDTSTIEEE